MNTTLRINPAEFSKEVLRLILATAQQRKCTPEEALNSLLDELAARAGFKPTDFQPA